MTAQQLDRLQPGLSTSGRTQSLGHSHSPRQPQHLGRKGRAELVHSALAQQTAGMVAAPQSNGTPAHDKFEAPAALKGVKRVNPLTDKFEVWLLLQLTYSRWRTSAAVLWLAHPQL